jgi:hypothetical protein
MKSTIDLIRELKSEAQQCWVVTLPVPFENTTIFIKSGTDERRGCAAFERSH